MGRKKAVYDFGLDFVRFSFCEGFESPLFDSLFHGLSQNSAQAFDRQFFDESFTIQLAQDSRQRVSVILQFLSDGVIHVEKVRDVGIAKKNPYFVTFYSNFFYIPEMRQVLNAFMRRYDGEFQVSRVDLAYDVNCSVQELWDCHRTQYKKKQTYKGIEGLETFYLGAKAYNKKHFIRVYNKKLDSQKKGKFHLFAEYLSMSQVTRVELQMNVLSCRNYSIEPSDILDLHNTKSRKGAFKTRLWEVYRSCCLNASGTDFPILPSQSDMVHLVPLQRKKKNSVLDELKYAKIMLGYARTLHNQGFDVCGWLAERLAEEKQPPA